MLLNHVSIAHEYNHHHCGENLKRERERENRQEQTEGEAEREGPVKWEESQRRRDRKRERNQLSGLEVNISAEEEVVAFLNTLPRKRLSAFYSSQIILIECKEDACGKQEFIDCERLPRRWALNRKQSRDPQY